ARIRASLRVDSGPATQGNLIRPLSRSASRVGVAEESASLRTPQPVVASGAQRSAAPKRWATWVLVAAAGALPLVVSPATADAYFLPKLVAARLVVITLLVIFGLAAIHGRLRMRRTLLDIPLALVVLSALVSTVFAINRNLAFFGSYGRYEGFLTILLYALLFWVAAQSLEDVHAATLVLRALLAAAFIVSMLSLLQAAFASLVGPGPTETGFAFAGVWRGYGTFGNPNALGAFLAMLLPIAAWEVLSARSLSGRWLAANVLIVLAL